MKKTLREEKSTPTISGSTLIRFSNSRRRMQGPEKDSEELLRPTFERLAKFDHGAFPQLAATVSSQCRKC